MADVIKKLNGFLGTPTGQVLRGFAAAVLYAVLLVLICFYFSGNGAFIYEGF